MFGINKFFVLSFSFWQNGNDALVVACLTEFHDAVNQGIQCVVLANTYVFAWIVLCATLAYDDVACDAFLTAPDFNTKSL